MTTATDLPVATETGTSNTRVIGSLALFEARRLVGHPLLWVGGLVSAALAVYELWEQAPVLNRVSVNLAWTMLPLAIATSLVAGWAVLRARGRSDADPPAAMPLRIEQRVGGIVLGLIGPATLAFLIQLAVLAWIFTRQPVTTLVWAELLVGPVYVMFAGTLGALLTRWFSHPATPLFAALALGGLMIAIPYDQANWGRVIDVEWLLPLAWPQDIIPYEVAFRPAGPHLIYLCCLTLLTGGAAMIGRTRLGWGLLILGLVGAVISGPAQLGPIPESSRIEAMGNLVGDHADLTCETHNLVRYCAMPGYEGWITRWADVTGPVIAAAPPSAVAGIEMRQYPAHNTTLLLDEEVYKDWWWIGPAKRDYASRDVVALGSMAAYWEEISWVSGLAYEIVCPPSRACIGQSQNIAVLWLMVQTPRIRSYTVDDPRWGSEYASVGDCMVRELWAKPDPGTRVLDNWDLLVDPNTSYEAGGAALGVEVPEGYDSNGALVAGCP